MTCSLVSSYKPCLVDSEGLVLLVSSFPSDFYSLSDLLGEEFDGDLPFAQRLVVVLSICSHLLLEEVSLMMTR